MLYTKKGDMGASGLFGTKERLPKDEAIYDALGTVDELNCSLGVCKHMFAVIETPFEIKSVLEWIQDKLFTIQAELAGAHKHLTATHVLELEEFTESLEQLIDNPHSFVIPGATCPSAYADLARTVARRAERTIVRVHRTQKLHPATLSFMNRLSSFLYALARYSTHITHTKERTPTY